MLVELDKIYAVWLREFKRFTNSKGRMVGSLGMPLLFMFALGGGIGSLLPGSNYGTFIVPGIVGMTLLFNSMFSGVSIIWDREFGFLKEMLVAPTSRLNIVLGRILGGATTSVLQGILILLLGTLTGISLPALPQFLLTIVVMTLIAASFVAVGIAFASVIREVETFQLVMNFLIMPLFFLSNALFPLDKMPDWLRAIASINPLTYGIDALRDLLLGSGAHALAVDLPVIFVFAAVVTVIASYLFSKTSI
ncbi:ABC-2 type transporter [Candidatus Burarchaeum australiense]|nr:ABC-2 type transporter [Candidatus Burarchaeum australiense]